MSISYYYKFQNISYTKYTMIYIYICIYTQKFIYSRKSENNVSLRIYLPENFAFRPSKSWFILHHPLSPTSTRNHPKHTFHFTKTTTAVTYYFILRHIYLRPKFRVSSIQILILSHLSYVIRDTQPPFQRSKSLSLSPIKNSSSHPLLKKNPRRKEEKRKKRKLKMLFSCQERNAFRVLRFLRER